MKYLFVDNFRGFSNTLLSIKDVNFLVGENSTGKTSILALINILDSPSFWFDQQFRTEEMALGNFQDIVSAFAQDKSYFRVGLLDYDPPGEGTKASVRQGFLLTFVEEDGLPVLSKYTFLADDNQVTTRFTRTTAMYKNEGLCSIRDDRKSIHEIFLKWVESHRNSDSKYERIKLPFGRDLALIYTAPTLGAVLKGEKGDSLAKQVPRFPGFRRPFNSIVWLAPIRTQPRRTYDRYRLDFSPEGEHTPYLIKKLLARRTAEQRKQADKFVRFIEDFGRASGLFESITVKDYIPRNKTSPFELDVVLTKKAFSIDNVGYGISQSLPIIVELFARPKGKWFAIQQPEIHLHPRAQTSLGEAIFELAVSEGKKFLVETHSDFTIDGFRLKSRENTGKIRPNAQILFFERVSNGNVLYEIGITAEGDLSELQPQAYRKFFIGHELRALRL